VAETFLADLLKKHADGDEAGNTLKDLKRTLDSLFEHPEDSIEGRN